MKKLLSILLILLPAAIFSQTTAPAKMFLKPEQFSTSVQNGENIYTLEEPVAKSIQVSVNVLNETIKAQKITIDSLKSITLNQGIQISNLQQQVNAADILVNSSTLTIGSEHNGKTIKISSQCVVTFPSGLDIKCRIIRTAKPVVTIAGSIITSQNYRSISGYPGRIDVDYTNGIALITGNLTK